MKRENTNTAKVVVEKIERSTTTYIKVTTANGDEYTIEVDDNANGLNVFANYSGKGLNLLPISANGIRVGQYRYA